MTTELFILDVLKYALVGNVSCRHYTDAAELVTSLKRLSEAEAERDRKIVQLETEIARLKLKPSHRVTAKDIGSFQPSNLQSVRPAEPISYESWRKMWADDGFNTVTMGEVYAEQTEREVTSTDGAYRALPPSDAQFHREEAADG